MKNVLSITAIIRCAAWATLVICGVTPAADRMVTEIYTVGFRPVDEIVALVRPLVPTPGTVVAYHDKLVVKATETTQAEVKRILAEVDRAPVNLVVSVRHTLDAEVQRDLDRVFARIEGADASASVGREPDPSQGGLRVEVGNADSVAGARIVRTQRSGSDRDVHSVRLLEGQEAFVQTGVSVPTPEQRLAITGIGVVARGGVRYRDVTKGFFVRPRLTPSGVSVEISTHRNTLGRGGGGTFDVRSSATTVSGALGRWMQVAGVSETSKRSATGIAHATRSRARDDYNVYLKVDRVPGQ